MRDPFATLELIVDKRSSALDPAFATPNGRARSVRIGRNEAALLVVNAKGLEVLAGDERIWRDAASAFAEPLVFDQTEARFRIYRLDIGLEMAQLRAWSTRNPGEPVLVCVKVRIEPDDATGSRRYERSWERTLQLVG